MFLLFLSELCQLTPPHQSQGKELQEEEEEEEEEGVDEVRCQMNANTRCTSLSLLPLSLSEQFSL